MMKFALPLAALLAAPAAAAFAWDRMNLADCQASVQRVAGMVSSRDPSVPRAFATAIENLTVSGQGVCQIDVRNIPGMEAVDGLAWRAERIDDWIEDGIPPRALDLRVFGFDPGRTQARGPSGRPPLAIEATLRQEPDASLLILERFEVFNGVGDKLVISGVMERVILSSTSMMQVSLGAATFKAGLVSMTLDGDVENPFSFNFDVNVQGGPQAGRQSVMGIISLLPDSLIDDSSRAELTDFAEDLPKPAGRLEVSVASDRGLGMLQVGMGVISSMDSDGESGMADAFDGLFDGLSAQATWTPSLKGTD